MLDHIPGTSVWPGHPSCGRRWCKQKRTLRFTCEHLSKIHNDSTWSNQSHDASCSVVESVQIRSFLACCEHTLICIIWQCYFIRSPTLHVLKFRWCYNRKNIHGILTMSCAKLRWFCVLSSVSNTGVSGQHWTIFKSLVSEFAFWQGTHRSGDLY